MNAIFLIVWYSSIIAILGLLAASTMGSAVAAPGAMEWLQTSDIASAPMPGMRLAAGDIDGRSADGPPASSLALASGYERSGPMGPETDRLCSSVWLKPKG